MLSLPRIVPSFIILASIVVAQSPEPTSARLPIRELAAFKDGHVFVMHEGEVSVDAKGEAVLDDLPEAIMGTFWPVVSSEGKKLVSTTAGRRRVKVERTALGIRELIEANIGAEVMFIDHLGSSVFGQIADIPKRTPEEKSRTEADPTGLELPETGQIVGIRTNSGLRYFDIAKITDLTFRSTPKPMIAQDEIRPRLTIKVSGAAAGEKTRLGYTYVQLGLRWIPNYKLVIDGKGAAKIAMQATLVNDLADFEDATVHLVIGVPQFTMKGTIDPIALSATAAAVNAELRRSAEYRGRSQMLSNFGNNAIMNNPVQMTDTGFNFESYTETDVVGEKQEDLYVFSLKNVTLKRGERMVVQVATFDCEYEDVYTLALPIVPPRDIRAQIGANLSPEELKNLSTAKIQHKLRLTNKTSAPFTTAPAMIMKGDSVIGQGLMTYTAPGGSSDLMMGLAIDIKAKKRDIEVSRNPNATRIDGDAYSEVSLDGTISLRNLSQKTAKLEIKRHVFGSEFKAEDGGKAEKLSLYDDEFAGDEVDPDSLWRSYSWPAWWNRLNGVGTVTWKIELAPGEAKDLRYSWRFFWR